MGQVHICASFALKRILYVQDKSVLLYIIPIISMLWTNLWNEDELFSIILSHSLNILALHPLLFFINLNYFQIS